MDHDSWRSFLFEIWLDAFPFFPSLGEFKLCRYDLCVLSFIWGKWFRIHKLKVVGNSNRRREWIAHEIHLRSR